MTEEQFEVDENHNRKTFCQIPFAEISEHVQRGKKSLSSFVNFLQQKAQIDQTYAQQLLKLDQTFSLSTFEEKGTSVRKTFDDIQKYIQLLSQHQLVLVQFLQDQIAQPLLSLQKESQMYVSTLETEIQRVNQQYDTAQQEYKKTKLAFERATQDLSENVEVQRIALHDNGVPEFELQRLSSKVKKCSDELERITQEKNVRKKNVLNTIIARDEMAMAVSVSYQKVEEERLDQISACLKRFAHIEKDHLQYRDSMLNSLTISITQMERAADIQLIIHNRCNPDNLHFQGRALSLLDWHWTETNRQQNELNDTSTLENFEIDDVEKYEEKLQSEENLVKIKTSKSSKSYAKMEQLVSALFSPNIMSVRHSGHSAENQILEKRLDDIDFSLCSLASLFQHEQSRVDFLNALNFQRSIQTKTLDNICYNQLLELFNQFLDSCVHTNDVKSAKTAMILADTFYKIDEQFDNEVEDPRKVYLQETICRHNIWKKPKFWEEALVLAICEELHKIPQQCSWEDLPCGSSKREGEFSREEIVNRVHNIVFGQLGSFTLSMVEFKVPLRQIRYFIESMCDAHELTEHQRFLLRKNLQEISYHKSQNRIHLS